MTSKHCAMKWFGAAFPCGTIFVAGPAIFHVLHASGSEMCVSRIPAALQQGHRKLGTSNVLDRSAPSMQQLLAPFISDGQLHIEVRFAAPALG